ncbi:M20 family metallopeptidase [Bacillus sp. 03113]|uniref:M20 family metallopeptidase n=1 Tax=Bacillus sp. 03113 TaxID=2578211 RepID=UPI001142B22C|nr:M20 family metallopeptidase [Bacillus sp. 03113]
MEGLLNRLEEIFPEMVELRRYFHQYPELSFQEVNTAAKIAEYLKDLGIEVKTGVGGNGVVGYIKGGKPGKTVALRADFDALPLQDEKGVEYKSKVPGVMHACGHDAHTSTLLGIAKVLSEAKDDLNGNVVLIHQFGEEISPGGAKPMIEAGCLDGVDAIFGTHLWSTIPVGEIGYRSGPIMAAADKFEIKLFGKGGHGSAPHQTVDSIVLGTTIIQQLQQIVSRRVDPLKPAVLSVGKFHSGNAFNIIADSAEIEGTVRTFDTDVQDFIIAEMEKVIKTTCEGFGATYEFNFLKGYPAVVNHPAETDLIVQHAIPIIGGENVKEVTPIMGGEDFAYYLEKVPGTFILTGAGSEESGAIYPHHHPKFNIDEKSMLIAAKILLSTSIGYLNKESAGLKEKVTTEN